MELISTILALDVFSVTSATSDSSGIYRGSVTPQSSKQYVRVDNSTDTGV